MKLENLYTMFSRVRKLCKKHNQKRTRILMLDESGVFMQRMTFRLNQCIVRNGTRGKTRSLTLRRISDHLIVMGVLSAPRHVSTPLVVLSGTKDEYRKRNNGKFETTVECLPEPTCCFMRPVAGIDIDRLYSWVLNHFETTAPFMLDRTKLLLVTDEYATHAFYNTISVFWDNGIIFVGLTAHNSNVTTIGSRSVHTSKRIITPFHESKFCSNKQR